MADRNELTERARETRRIGRFHVLDCHVWEQPEVARAVLRDVIVLKCEYQAWASRFEYIGLHPVFEFSPLHLMVPDYLPTVTMHNNDGAVSYSVEWGWGA